MLGQDLFLGITVPNIRQVVKGIYNKITLSQISTLLNSKYHEERLCALIILVEKMKHARKYKDDFTQISIVTFYINNAHLVNGWDLVDLSAPYILGEYILMHNAYDILYKLANTEDMWKQRISIVANLPIIKKGEYTHIFEIASRHINTKHDLIQKAIGWMLREVGKKDYIAAYNFLKENYNEMPRTMLRYSIEKFDEKIRQKFLKGEI